MPGFHHHPDSPLLAQAEQLGEEHGRAAASYTVLTADAATAIVHDLVGGDVDTLEDHLPSGSLSGEWADSLTPLGLVQLLGLDPGDVDPEGVAELCDAYEAGHYQGAYEVVLETALVVAGLPSHLRAYRTLSGGHVLVQLVGGAVTGWAIGGSSSWSTRRRAQVAAHVREAGYTTPQGLYRRCDARTAAQLVATMPWALAAPQTGVQVGQAASCGHCGELLGAAALAEVVRPDGTHLLVHADTCLAGLPLA